MPWLFYIFLFIITVSKVVNLLRQSHNLLDELTLITPVEVQSSYILHQGDKRLFFKGSS